jgi:hypothetical protein
MKPVYRKKETEAKSKVPDWGDKVDGIVLRSTLAKGLPMVNVLESNLD